MKQKAEKLNSDIYVDDLALLNQNIVEQGLTSRKDGLHFWANIVKGSNVEKEQVCQYRFRSFCTNEPLPQKKLRKTTDEYCQACLKAQSIAREDIEAKNESAKLEHDFFDLSGTSETNRLHPVNKWLHVMEFIDNLNLEIEELKKPVESYLEDIANLETELKKLQPLKQSLENENATLKKQLETLKQEILAVELQKRVSLENDNTFLKGQLEKLKHEPMFEKNAWLTVEVQQANREIETLKAKIEQQTALINNFQGIATR